MFHSFLAQLAQGRPRGQISASQDRRNQSDRRHDVGCGRRVGQGGARAQAQAFQERKEGAEEAGEVEQGQQGEGCRLRKLRLRRCREVVHRFVLFQ